jgi:hypothetical protein
MNCKTFKPKTGSLTMAQRGVAALSLEVCGIAANFRNEKRRRAWGHFWLKSKKLHATKNCAALDGPRRVRDSGFRF